MTEELLGVDLRLSRSVVACIIIDDEVAVIKGVVTFCVSETLALATIGVKLPDIIIVLATKVLLFWDVLCNCNTEEVTGGMANVPGSDVVDCT